MRLFDCHLRCLSTEAFTPEALDSIAMAILCDSLKAIAHADERVQVAMSAIRFANLGSIMAHSIT